MDDKNFIKKEYKNLSTFEKVMTWLIPSLAVICLVVATLYLFILKQECVGLDKEFAYCYVHPATLWGVLGLILFYFGGFYISGLIPYLLIFFFKVEDDAPGLAVGKTLAIICMLGFFLIYV